VNIEAFKQKFLSIDSQHYRQSG